MSAPTDSRTDNPNKSSSKSPNDATIDTTIDADRELRELLRRSPVPPPPPQLFERAVAHAVRERDGQHNNQHDNSRRDSQRDSERRYRHARARWLATGFGAAVAAGLVALAVSPVFGPSIHNSELHGPTAATSATAIPTVSMSLYEPETVRLVFAADASLEDATMTVLLPQGVELEGFPGQREIRWDTSLAEGRNLLPLTLIATGPSGGELLARLEHESRDRTFRLRIEIG